MDTHQISKAEYVCPMCFHQFKNCICNHLEINLIQIDLEIQECIRLLNAKGYLTLYSCSSYLEEYHRSKSNNVMG